MALDADNVRVAVTGAIYKAPSGTARPTDAEASLNVAYIDGGYVSDAGVTESRDRSTTDIVAWQNADTVRRVVTDATLTYAFTFIETKDITVEAFYGATVDPATGAVEIVPSATGGRAQYVIDVIDGDNVIRIDIPDGEITEVGDQVYASGEPIGYEVTITAYPVDGVAAVKYYSELVDESSSSSS